MLNAYAFAHATTIVSVVLYTLCRVISLVAPDFLFSIAKSWFHTVNIESLRQTMPMDMGTFLLGGMSLALLVWSMAFATITLYNRLAKKG